MAQGTTSYLFTAEITRVTFQKPGNDWVVVQVALDDVQPEGRESLPPWMQTTKKFGVTGFIGPVQVGDLLDIEGAPKRHIRYGWQIEATQAQTCARQDERALFSFLRKLPNVGPQRAALIVKHFGSAEEVFDVLDTAPERLAEIPGINEERALDAAESYKQLAGVRDAWLFCRELKLQPRLAARIMDRLGAQARSLIEADPFALMTVIAASFRDCDSIRRALNIADDDPRRVAAGMLVVLRAAGRSGDCWFVHHHLFGGGVDWQVEKARESVGLTDDLLRRGLDVLQEPTVVNAQLTLPPRVIVEEERVYMSEIHAAEKSVCRGLSAMLGG